MPPDIDPPDSAQRARPAGTENRHVPLAPDRHEDRAVPRDGDTKGAVARRQPLGNLSAGKLEHGERVSGVLGEIEPPMVRRQGKARRIPRRLLPRFSGSQHEVSLRLHHTVLEAVAHDLVLVATGGVQTAVRRERETQESGLLRERLQYLSRAGINHLKPLLAPAAEQHREPAAIGRERHRQRQAAKVERLAGRVEMQARRQERLLAQVGAGIGAEAGGQECESAQQGHAVGDPGIEPWQQDGFSLSTTDYARARMTSRTQIGRRASAPVSHPTRREALSERRLLFIARGRTMRAAHG